MIHRPLRRRPQQPIRQSRHRAPAAAVLLPVAVLLGVTALAGCDTQEPAKPAAPITVDIGFFSDFHGSIQAEESDGNALRGGAEALTCTIAELRASNENTVILSNGDNVGGSQFASAILQDVPTIEFLRDWLQVDAVNIGNHEFDEGFPDVATRLTAPENAPFPYLGANITGSNGGYAAADHLEDYFSYTAKDSAGNEVRIGFVGTITPETPAVVFPGGVTGLEFQDIYQRTNEVARALSDGDRANGEADIIIALTHTGHAELDISQFSGDVDAVFTGHTHQLFVGEAANGSGLNIPVIEPWDYGRGVGHLQLTYEPTSGAFVFTTAEVIETATCPAENQDLADPDLQAWHAAVIAQADAAGAQPVGELAGDFLRGMGGEHRGTESTIGNLLANVLLFQLNLIRAADIGVINPGGIRADLLAGQLTYAQAFTVLPFANPVGTVDLTGAQFTALLEQQWQAPGSSRPFLRLGLSANVSYEFDPTAPPGQRITHVWLTDSAGVPQPIDPAATYTIASNAFLLAGGDSFTVLAEGTGRVDTGMLDVDGLLAYLEAHGPISPDLTQYSIGVTDLTGTLAAPTLRPGDSFAFNLSSLLFTNDEPRAENVLVSLGGVPIGSFPIDPTPTADPALDETGRAQVSFRVPVLPQLSDGAPIRLEVHLDTAAGQLVLARDYTVEASN